MAELLGLLEAEGFTGFRDARGPMGFTQRQGNGKFTSDEADEFIAQLYEQAELAEAAEADDTKPTEPAPAPATPPVRQKLSAQDRAIRDAPAEVLAAELERRGWRTRAPG